jgi:hypothetical protein
LKGLIAMPLYIRWADEAQTAILVQAVGKWTWETFYEVIEEACRMIDATGCSHKVHTILDWSKNASYPPDSLVHSRTLLKRQHPRQGICVFVGFNSIVSGIYQLFVQVSGKTVQNFMPITAQTINEALEKLAELPQPDA